MPSEAPADQRVADLLEGLNAPQREAVMHGDGPLLILAGAGSGKTRVLTHRIAYLVHTQRARAGEILAITFTNKAADEMRERVELLLGHSTRAMWVMTFHAACARMLRAEAPRLGYTRQFTIYDQADSRRLVKRCLDELGVDPKRFTPGAVQHQISDAKNKLRDAEDYAQMVGGYFEQTVADAYELYERELRPDERDGLRRPARPHGQRPRAVPRGPRALRRRLPPRARRRVPGHQPRPVPLLQLLAGEHRNLAVVGDDAQSIYRFRGADIRNILDFQDDFPDANVIKLEQNYRSTQTILDASPTRSSPTTAAQMHKTLWTDLGEGDPVDRPRARRRARRGALRGRRDRAAASTRACRWPRSRASTGPTRSRGCCEDTLVRAEVAYQVIGGTKFYERAEIKDAIAYLTLLANPADAISFTRVANSPKRGIGQTSLSRVLAHAETMGITIWDAALDPAGVPGPRAPRRSARSSASWPRWRGCASASPTTSRWATCSRPCCTRPATSTRWRPSARSRPRAGSRTSRSSSRSRASSTARTPPSRTASTSSCRRSRCVADTDTRVDDGGMVTLMTLHNAKGLEYPIVFMIGCEEGVFPHSRSLDEGTLEEERRLCYVGMTRAMRTLTLTHARRRNVFGSRAYGLPSRFLAEIPPDLVDRERRQRLAGHRARAPIAAARHPPARLGLVGLDALRRRRPRPRATSGSATTSCTPPSARAS